MTYNYNLRVYSIQVKECSVSQTTNKKKVAISGELAVVQKERGKVCTTASKKRRRRRRKGCEIMYDQAESTYI